MSYRRAAQLKRQAIQDRDGHIGALLRIGDFLRYDSPYRVVVRREGKNVTVAHLPRLAINTSWPSTRGSCTLATINSTVSSTRS